MATAVHRIETLHADRIAAPEAPFHALQRRFSGRYARDPFGLDSQVADTLIPVLNTLVRATVLHPEHVPVDGPAVIVSNRGFGLAEPTALALAVKQATGRRLRVVGAPSTPLIGPASRRIGAIAASDHDVTAALRAGHLVGVPLAATLLRTDAGAAPLALAQAMTHNPIVPAAVKPIGRFGGVIGSWTVRFGPLVTLPEAYDPDDPLAAARFADAMRSAVHELLVDET